MLLSQLNSIHEIAASQWDALLTDAQPFLRHAFLSALEDSGSVGGRTGWQPAHAALLGAQGQLLAAMPGYVKSHSYGEYVFDHGRRMPVTAPALTITPSCSAPFPSLQ